MNGRLTSRNRSNVPRSTAYTSTRPAARIVAFRGWFISSATSPNDPPGPISSTFRSAPSGPATSTSTVPRRIR